MIPILIGGGHNNAYPLLLGCRKVNKGPISVLNLDAHPDFRVCEGRHSGNPFSYARKAALLDKYALLGYQMAYMPNYILEAMKEDPDCWLCSYEEIALEGRNNFAYALQEAIKFIEQCPSGLELDIDVIEGADASAASPSGCSFTEARTYVRQATRYLSPLYFHLCEARAVDEPPLQAAKRLAYLVYDLLSAYPRARRAKR